MSNESVLQFLYPPMRAAEETRETLEQLQNMDILLSTGDQAMDEYLYPFVPGDCCFYISRPGHSKTVNSIRMARVNSKLLRERGDPRMIVYFTTETTVPEFVSLYTAPDSGYTVKEVALKLADMQKVNKSIAYFAMGNVCVVGRDTEAASVGILPDLDDLHVVLLYLADQGTPAALVIVDYLQAIYDKRDGDERKTVSRNTMYCKQLALTHNTVFWVPAQAVRGVDGYSGIQMPRLADGQWSSTIEIAGDKVFAATRASIYMDEDDTYKLTKNGSEYSVLTSTLIQQVLKCRWSDAGRKFSYEFDWANQRMVAATPETVMF